MLDLVVNHTSDAHPWFQAARSNPRSPFRDWYVWLQAEPPDRFEGMMFPGVENETWTYDEQAHAWYRHRFYRFEPALNTDNPAVREEIRKVALFWVRLGVTGFRIDEVLSQAGDVPTGPRGEASEKCRDDIDVSVGRCALVPAATTDKERVPVNGGMQWFFFATGAAIWIALWAAIRLERRLGLRPATRNAPAARPTGRHHRCRNMPPGPVPRPHISCPPVRACPPGHWQSSRGPSAKPTVLAPPPGPAAPSR
jgi:maltose alpha-D-glucosyltransferase/alpha-amylase